MLSNTSILEDVERRGTPDWRKTANDALSTAELSELRWEAMICGDGDRREEREAICNEGGKGEEEERSWLRRGDMRKVMRILLPREWTADNAVGITGSVWGVQEVAGSRIHTSQFLMNRLRPARHWGVSTRGRFGENHNQSESVCVGGEEVLVVHTCMRSVGASPSRARRERELSREPSPPVDGLAGWLLTSGSSGGGASPADDSARAGD